jgi:hypothetical protein
MNAKTIYVAGFALAEKAQAQARATSTQQAAKNLRKQGYSLPVAMMILTGKAVA